MHSSITKWYIRLFKAGAWRYFNDFKRLEKLSFNEMQERRLKKLQDLVLYAYENVPFYKSFWDDHSINPRIKCLEDFNKFPVIDKTVMVDAIDKRLFSQDPKHGKLSWASTTGSSGKPFKFPIDEDNADIILGKHFQLESWSGKRVGEKTAKLWRGKLKKSWKVRLTEFIYNTYTICIYDPDYPKETALSAQRIDEIIKELNRIKPVYINGFVSSLELVSKHIISNNKKLEFEPKGIATGAETLTDTAREVIEEAFKSKVFNRYGGTESLMSHERTSSSGSQTLAVLDDLAFIETYKDGKPVFDDSGEVVITNFYNRILPLIKYSIGDVATISSKDRNGPYRTMSSIEGRVNDSLKLKDGGLITSHLWQNYLKKAPFIKQYQIIQESYDLVNIYYVLEEQGFVEDQMNLVKDLLNNALEGFEVNWEQKEFLDFGVGGKFKQFITKVK